MKEGDKAAFDLLYEKYRNMALHTAYLITGNYSLSEDIVQDTFVRVYLHCGELKNDGGFKAWMMQILVRTAYRSGKKAGKELPDEEIFQKADVDKRPSPLDLTIVREEAKRIAEAVRELPFKQKSVVVLYYYQECRISEIAKILGCREGTVKSRLHAAKKQLRRKLETEYGTEACEAL
ncbi:MAG: RNA polymerase sigma factor [bacterium]|nr:RNA polymerase sigma factor [bacterium]